MYKTEQPFEQLTPLFDNPAMASVLPTRYETDGFIFAIAAAPEIPMPERWMPWLIKSSQGNLANNDVDTIADKLMGCLREHLDAMRQDQVSLPPPCKWRRETDTVPAELCDWLRGLLSAHQHVESDWQKAWDNPGTDDAIRESRSQRLTRSLRLFSTLADIELALASRTPEQASELKENLPLLWRQLPQQLNDYVSLAGELAGMLPNQFETFKSSAANDAD